MTIPILSDALVDTEKPTRSSAYGFLKPDDLQGQPDENLTSYAIWRGFKQHTTAHGIPHVDNAQGNTAFSAYKLRISELIEFRRFTMA